MNINASSLKDLYSGLNTSFNKGLKNAQTYWSTVAMKIPSSGREETYEWLADLPGIREWIGDRIINELGGHSYTVRNKLFESTIKVKRTDIEDDRYGIYGTLAERMGDQTAKHPDDLVFSLLEAGSTTKCFDGQYFFDTDHLSYDKDGNEVSASNVTTGDNAAWYLMDCSQPLRPLIYQERVPFDFQSITDANDMHVFIRDEYLYGVRGRSNAGFGLWQLAYKSKAALNEANFVTSRVAMTSLRKADGRPLGVRPTHMVVPSTLEATARKLLKAETIAGGESNVWAGSVELVVTPYIG